MARLSHLNDKGEARMVDVSAKTITQRAARAEGFVAMAPTTLALVETGTAKKGDVLATARLAGIMAAKKTHELIPLCHPLAITKRQRGLSSQPRAVRARCHRRSQSCRPNGGRDGSPDRGQHRLPHDL